MFKTLGRVSRVQVKLGELCGPDDDGFHICGNMNEYVCLAATSGHVHACRIEGGSMAALNLHACDPAASAVRSTQSPMHLCPAAAR
jgi:hypothetical protein